MLMGCELAFLCAVAAAGRGSARIGPRCGGSRTETEYTRSTCDVGAIAPGCAMQALDGSQATDP